MPEPKDVHWSELSIASALRTQGWTVLHKGRDRIVYVELYDDTPRELVIPGEKLVGTGHVIYVPSEAAWQECQPEWAAARRTEILSRVRLALPPPDYEYCPE